jgi:tripartite-type tricarboxylate transporter receptor subunit TctC
LVTTAPRRSPLLPNVQTAREAGYPQLEALEWFGLFVPATTPRRIVRGVEDTVHGAIASEAFKGGLAQQSFDATTSSFAQLIRSDTARWGELVSTSDFKPLDET